jgi:crossover junction endodeoxyribonuclease RuvC
MASRLTFGIDPGLRGAIVTPIDGEPGPTFDMPVMDGEVDARSVTAFLREQRDANPDAVIAVALERIHARPMRNEEGKAIEGSVARHNLAEGFG